MALEVVCSRFVRRSEMYFFLLLWLLYEKRLQLLGLLEIKKIFLMSVWQEELQEAKVIEACQTDP